jgi:hypothetical protein
MSMCPCEVLSQSSVPESRIMEPEEKAVIIPYKYVACDMTSESRNSGCPPYII